MKNKIMLALGLVAALAAGAMAQIIPAPQVGGGSGNSYSGYLTNQPALTYSTTYTIDVSQYDGSKISASVLYSSVNFSNAYFTDGSKSTGSFTVIDYTALSSATATNNATVISTSGLNGATFTVNGIPLLMGQQWSRGATTALTAASLASAIHTAVPAISASATGAVVYATATFGSAGNAYTFASNNSSVTVAAASFSGGRDNASISINGTTLTQGTAWTAATSSVTTAANIVTAINANATLNVVVVATSNFNTAAAYGVVNVTSLFNGTVYNYALTTSTPTALSVFKANMVGGTNPQDTLLGQVFRSTSTSGIALGTPVLYAVGSASAIGGLTTGTTYFYVPVGTQYFSLAKYSTSAVAGLTSDFVTVTSTNSQLPASMNTYTFVPLAWAGTASFVWQSSNDDASYGTTPLTTSVSVTSNTVSTLGFYDFGFYNFRYLRLSFTAPTSGGLLFRVPVNIKQDGIGRY